MDILNNIGPLNEQTPLENGTGETSSELQPASQNATSRSPSVLMLSWGRVRTKTVKRASKVLIERFYPKLTLDFETNKRMTSEIAEIQSKRLRNKIAGYTTHLMKRIQKGPVRGISFKLQEEERERKDQYVPEVSALDLSHTNGQLEVDTETAELVKSLGFKIPLQTVAISSQRGPKRFAKRA